MNIRRTLVNAAAATVTILVCSPYAAFAADTNWKTWRSEWKPLFIRNAHSNELVGKTYGKWHLSDGPDGLASLTAGKLSDQSANGRRVYFKSQTQTNSGLCIAPNYTSCNTPWYDYGQKNRSQEYAYGAWSGWIYTSRGIDRTGDYARVYVYGCENQAWQPDDCSGNAFLRGARY